MHFLFAAAVAVVCLGSALAQAPIQLPCVPGSFVADSFDAVQFKMFRSYHDVQQLYTLYETPNGKPAMFFDFNKGIYYHQYANGTCGKVENSDAQMTMAALAQATLEFQVQDVDGVTLLGLEYTNGGFTARLVLTDTCESVFVSFLVDNRLSLAYFHSGQRDFTQADTDKVAAAAQTFESANCSDISDRMVHSI